MTILTFEVVANCKICQKAKYDRHSQKQVFRKTPIPSHVGEILHINIFSTDKKHFFTCLDKLSKFTAVQPIASRTIIDIQSGILQLLSFFRTTKTIYCENEPTIKSETIKTLLSNQYDVQVVNAPSLHSTSNGQVERFHSTLGDIARCLTSQRKITETVEAVLQATIEFNRTDKTEISK